MPDQGEKTEPATPRRRQQARQRGQVARSVELTSAVLLLLGLGFLRFYGVELVEKLVAAMRLGLTFSYSRDVHLDTVLPLLPKTVFWFLMLTFPVFLFAFAVALFMNLVQVGIVFSGYPIIPSLEKINPIRGLQRLFSVRSLVELVKSIFKIAAVSFVAYFSIRGELSTLVQLTGFSPAQAGLKMAHSAFVMGFRIALLFFFMAILDYIYQKMEFERSIRMSKQEVKEEYKHLEGDPFVRQRIRQRQREIMRRRMLHEVPTADVVITNPTHIAVALRYDPEKMKAPKVVAKGIRLLAEQIVAIAEEHKVPIFQNPPLAQALYKACEVGDPIPPDLYSAVAEVLAFVYSTSRKKKVSA